MYLVTASGSAFRTALSIPATPASQLVALLPAGLHGDNLADGLLLAFILHELAVVAASEPDPAGIAAVGLVGSCPADGRSSKSARAWAA